MDRTEILNKFTPEKDNLLGILHELQNNNPQNYLSEEDMKEVAAYLNTTYSHVYGVATYYTMYSVRPRGKYIIRVCNSPVCNMEGSTGIIDTVSRVLGIGVGETTGDKIFTLEHTECLGRCHVAPSMMVGEDIYGDLTEEKVREILKNYK
ncbi:MAG: NAD(P)H-dependent oxidoreductase subunit E [Bacteroidales bacterium]